MSGALNFNPQTPWFELFSRGARDWLRHNEKVREAVRQSLPDLVARAGLDTSGAERSVRVPVHLLEHARFRLADAPFESGAAARAEAGQGAGQVGDVLRPLLPPDGGEDDDGDGAEGSGYGEGELRLLLELDVDDIMDWLWEELKLPDLQPRTHRSIAGDDYVREGWDRHGARARLDRRRTMREAVKRRAIQPGAPLFTNEDLRYRQLVRRPRPATSAVILFALDVSASMTEAERKLAKTFFFFVLQGIRRKYAQVETRFIAHTTEAWEFSERDFFRVSGSGGTGASAAFRLALEMLRGEYDPARYNAYLFYASDGENFTEDRLAAGAALAALGELLNYIGYVETVPGTARSVETEMKMICADLARRGTPVGTSVLATPDDVWPAIRSFFVEQAEHAMEP